jgi:hypothetical protein
MADERNFMSERGLMSAEMMALHAAPEVEPPEDELVLPRTLPDDYQARVRALELALEWSGYTDDKDTERTLQRALDFHCFLMGVAWTPPPAA